MSAHAQAWNRGSTWVRQALNYPVHQYAFQDAVYGHSLDPCTPVPVLSQTVPPQFFYVFDNNPTGETIYFNAISSMDTLQHPQQFLDTKYPAASLKPSAPFPTKSLNTDPYPETAPLPKMVEYPTTNVNLVTPRKSKEDESKEDDSPNMIVTSSLKLMKDRNTITTHLNDAVKVTSTVPRKSRRAVRGNGPGAKKQELVKTQTSRVPLIDKITSRTLVPTVVKRNVESKVKDNKTVANPVTMAWLPVGTKVNVVKSTAEDDVKMSNQIYIEHPSNGHPLGHLEASTGNGDHRDMPRCEVLTNAKLAEHPFKRDASILTSNTKSKPFILIQERSDGMCNLGEVNCGILISKGWIPKNELRVYTAEEETEISSSEMIEECSEIIEELNSKKMTTPTLWSEIDGDKMNDHELVMLPLPMLE